MLLENEQELIRRAQKDPAAFAPLFEKYYDNILHYILHRTASVQVAEDITSEIFLKALKNLWHFQWRGVPFSAWLYRIASNELKRYFRYPHTKHYSFEDMNKFQPIDQNDLLEEVKKADLEVQKHEAFFTVQKCLIQLPIDYQEVISLRFFEQKKIKEIGQILGKKEGTVKSLLSRGLEQLRTLVKDSCNVLDTQGFQEMDF